MRRGSRSFARFAPSNEGIHVGIAEEQLRLSKGTAPQEDNETEAKCNLRGKSRGVRKGEEEPLIIKVALFRLTEHLTIVLLTPTNGSHNGTEGRLEGNNDYLACSQQAYAFEARAASKGITVWTVFHWLANSHSPYPCSFIIPLKTVADRFAPTIWFSVSFPSDGPDFLHGLRLFLIVCSSTLSSLQTHAEALFRFFLLSLTIQTSRLPIT